jgi:hypothetical protein
VERQKHSTLNGLFIIDIMEDDGDGDDDFAAFAHRIK